MRFPRSWTLFCLYVQGQIAQVRKEAALTMHISHNPSMDTYRIDLLFRSRGSSDVRPRHQAQQGGQELGHDDPFLLRRHLKYATAKGRMFCEAMDRAKPFEVTTVTVSLALLQGKALLEVLVAS
jgi:hypothetical protein